MITGRNKAARAARPLVRQFHLTMLAITVGLSMNVAPARAQYVSGSVGDLTAILKFKQHKDNPTQTPIGTPITVVFVGAALLFLPSMVSVTGSTIFGSSGGSVSGGSGTIYTSWNCSVFDGETTMLVEDSYVWAKLTGQWTSQSGTASTGGFYRIGGQKEVAPDWFVGAGFGGGNLSTIDNNGSAGTGQAYDAAVVVKHAMGPWLVEAGLSIGTNSMHTTQLGGQLWSDTNIYTGDLKLRGSYEFAYSTWYLRPRLDLDVTYTNRPGFTEMTPGAPLLAVDGLSKTRFIATPTLELGGRYTINETTILRPYMAVGVSYVPDATTTSSASFVGPLVGNDSFQVTSYGPNIFTNLEAGLQLYQSRGFEAKVEYAMTVADNYLSQSASLRGTWHF